MRSPGPPIICVEHATADRLTGPPRGSAQPAVPLAGMLNDPGHYAGIGGATALARTGRTPVLRPGNDTAFAGLRNAPTTLTGAFSSPWATEPTKTHRFVFRGTAPGSGFSTAPCRASAGSIRRVARRRPSPSSLAFSTSAPASRSSPRPAWGHSGTQTAGGFPATRPWAPEGLRAAPAGWERKNIQIVLRAEAVGGSPGAPEVTGSARLATLPETCG